MNVIALIIAACAAALGAVLCAQEHLGLGLFLWLGSAVLSLWVIVAEGRRTPRAGAALRETSPASGDAGVRPSGHRPSPGL